MATRKMTEAQDKKLDRAKGVKEGSPRDMRQDRKNGVMDCKPTKGGKRAKC